MKAKNKLKIIFLSFALLFLWHHTTVVYFIASKLHSKDDANTHRGAADSIKSAIDSSISFRNTPYPGADDYTRHVVARLGLSPLPNVKPLDPKLGPVFNDVTSFRYPISIPSCREVNGRRNIFIAVISAADNFEKRATIRQTWAKDLNNVWNTLTGFAGFAFILGRSQDNTIQKKIGEENETHKDIIQIDMTDVYMNLPIKMAGLLNWIYKKCANFKGFILKLDDDVYLGVRTLEYFIHRHDPFSPSIIGRKNVHSYRSKEGKETF